MTSLGRALPRVMSGVGEHLAVVRMHLIPGG